MGSSCSILNDTEYDVWITHDINWEDSLEVATGMLGLFAGAANLLAHAPVGTAGTSRQSTETTIVGLTRRKWTQIADVLNMSTVALSGFLSIKKEEAEKMKSAIKEFQNKAERIVPGEKYTWSGTLSLTMRVYVMNDKLQWDDRACSTGSTAGSEKVYPISRYFRKLDVY